jgi:hypothetical protein
LEVGAASKFGAAFYWAGECRYDKHGGSQLDSENFRKIQLRMGGKKMPQKFGEGALNSTGTSDPS